MLRGALNGITGMRIHATDGDLGHVHDVYVHDDGWRVRYFHVDTGHWLLGRHVLLAPSVVQRVDGDDGRIHTTLSRQQIRESPDIATHKPVPQQHRPQLHEYFPWIVPSATWQGEETAARLHTLLLTMRGQAVTTTREAIDDDRHLWSVRGLSDYAVEGTDGDLGRVDDLLVHPATWTIRSLVGDAGGLLDTERFLVPAEAI
jgi:PRC-barrel domain protein